MQSFLHLLGSMCGHEAEADEGVVRRNRGRYHRVHEHAFLEEVAGDGKGLEVVAHIQRYDGRGCVADFKACFAETVEGEVGVSPQRFLDFGFGLHYLQSLECRGSGCRGDGGCEYV